MRFEWDEAKSEANDERHNISFEDACALWSDPDALAVPARKRGERRFMLIASLSGSVWSAVFTKRGDSVRIISVRPATDTERKAYYGSL